MPTEEQWDEYLETVGRYLATGKLDRDEIDYKLEIREETGSCSPCAPGR